MNNKYRPSSGIEGALFHGSYCGECARDENECQILAKTYIFAVDDEKYPDEWIYDNSKQPTCTAYVESGEAATELCIYCGSSNVEYTHSANGTQSNGVDVGLDCYHCRKCGKWWAE